MDARIQVYGKLTRWETDGDGITVGDEPEVVREWQEEYPCEPDSIDREEGLTRVDLAAKILNDRLNVTETSNYPWQVGSWYSASWEADAYEMREYDAQNGEHSAHLEGFTPEEEAAIFEKVKEVVWGMR